ncbi:50S ribosomal protein L11 methyltransferase [Porphyromonas pogonae]|uniref:50S ribosomal protein L11 methyltransferase n=1 Tax=Porphyromonas pogonae TaxID=867595 RepID=UPI002E789403|nr:50S ribosomal protein L11 methyltransferase [Porphyromonas pogonae]
MVYICDTFSILSNPLGTESDTLFDILSDLIAPLGFESFDTSDGVLKAYIPALQKDDVALHGILQSFPIEGVVFAISSEEQPDINWNEEWEKNYFQPIEFLGGRCVIRAPFHPEAPNAEAEIVISPKMAFGTGNHETTSLMITYLMEHDVQGAKVLDMGCGTGVLGILALKLGANNLTAIDIDHWAYQNVCENARLNHVQNIVPIEGDATALEGLGLFDVILANITRNILLADMDQYDKVLAPGGRIVFSGFYQEDCELIRSKASLLGLIPVEEHTLNNWAQVVVCKP